MEEFLNFSIIGFVTGCIYALTASGLVITYTTSGIFNFAHGAIGMVAAYTYWQLHIGWGWPTWISLIAVLFVAAPLFGALIERVLIRPLHGAAVDLSLVITLGLLLMLIGVAYSLWNPQRVRILPHFFAGRAVKIGDLSVNYNRLLIVVTAIIVAVALRLFFVRTRTGVAMRAVVDNPDLVAMAGASPVRIQQLSWALGAMLAALAGVLVAPISRLDVLQLTLLVINGYAAAMFGRLRSLPKTVVGALAIGMGGSYCVAYMPDVVRFLGRVINLSQEGGIADYLVKIQLILPMLFLFVVLIVLPQDRLRMGSLSAPQPPAPGALRPSLIWGGVLVLFAIVLAPQLSTVNIRTASKGVTLACVLLSLVVLTGYGGLVSLCQMTFVGLGAYAMGTWAKGGSPFGLIAAAALAAAFGIVLALPTLKMRGLYLALATLAFAAAMDTLFFNEVLGQGGSIRVPRVDLPLASSSDEGYLIFVTIVFALMGIGVLALRRGRYGRRLSALNDSPAACATLGLNVNWTKLAVFAVAAAMAGFGGALYAAVPGQVSNNDFVMLNSLVLLLLVRIGGISTVTGALLAASFFAAFPLIQAHLTEGGATWASNLQFLLTGIGAISLGRDPHGMGGRIAQAAAALRRRRGAGTPSAPVVRSSVEEESLATV